MNDQSMNILAALASLGPTLPVLLTHDEWSRFSTQLSAELERARQTETESERLALLIRWLGNLRQEFPLVWHRVRSMAHQIQERGPEPEVRVKATWSDLLAQAEKPLNAPTVYLEWTATRRAGLGKRFHVTLRCRSSTWSGEADSESPEPVEVRVALEDPESVLEIRPPAEPWLSVGPASEASAIFFEVTPKSPGLQAFDLVFYVGERELSRLTLTVDVEAKEDAETIATGEGVGLVWHDGRALVPHDLELLVEESGDLGQTVSYRLHSSRLPEFQHLQLGESQPIGSLDEVQKKITRDLEAYARGKEPEYNTIDVESISERLAGVGHNLYKKLFSDALRAQYRKFRRSVRTLHVVSNATWLPFELIKPYESSTDDPEIIDDDFLCMKFEMTCWYAKARPAPRDVSVRSLAVILAQTEGEEDELPHSEAEAAFVRGHLSRRGVEDRSSQVNPPRRKAVLRMLREDCPDLLHFVGHAGQGTHDAEGSFLQLSPNEVMRARDIHGAVQTGIERAHPIVVLAACATAQGGLVFGQAEGWIPRWIEDGECSALLVTRWSISDASAAIFVRAFYEEITNGPTRTLGAAVRAARHKVRAERPNEPTWLAFTAYGHPELRIWWGHPVTLP